MKIEYSGFDGDWNELCKFCGKAQKDHQKCVGELNGIRYIHRYPCPEEQYSISKQAVARAIGIRTIVLTYETGKYIWDRIPLKKEIRLIWQGIVHLYKSVKGIIYLILSKPKKNPHTIKTMKIQRIRFTKRELEIIPEKERIFFIQILNLLTELNLLNKISVSYKTQTGHEIADKSLWCHKIFLTLMTAGKLHEGWQILTNDFFSGPSEAIVPKLSKQSKENLKLLKDYFSQKNHLYRIRNKFAFHSDSEEIKTLYEGFSYEEPFELYWSEYTTNSFSTTYFDVLTAILSDIEADKDQAIETLFKENITNHIELFRSLIGEIIQIYFQEYLNEAELIEVPENIDVYNPLIPFFFNGQITP